MKKVGNLNVPTTMTELRDDLALQFAEHRAGYIKAEVAKEAANIAGKIIKSIAVQLEYRALRKEMPEIPFAE